MNGRCARSSIMCSLMCRPLVLVCVMLPYCGYGTQQAAQRHRRRVARLPGELVRRQVVAERVGDLRVEQRLLLVAERRVRHVQVDVVGHARAPVEEVAGVDDQAGPDFLLVGHVEAVVDLRPQLVLDRGSPRCRGRCSGRSDCPYGSMTGLTAGRERIRQRLARHAVGQRRAWSSSARSRCTG